MQPRANNSITMMIAQAMEKMRELKELQFFGGDALNLKRYRTTITAPPDATQHCYRLIMTPEDPTTCMPFLAQTKPSAPNAYTGAVIEAVHRTDGKFEYLIITRANFDSVARSMDLTIEYTGTAQFTINQIG